MADSLQGLESLTLKDQLIFNRFSKGVPARVPFELVHQAIENVVESQPSATAVEHDGSSITYQELEEAANGLANTLMLKGLKQQERVCLVLQRSISMVVAILAVLKCGCQYVPLDGGVTPSQVITHIIKDTDAKFILCLAKFCPTVEQACDSRQTILVLDSWKANDAKIPTARPSLTISPSDGAYVIYTSGSTGIPKGVDVAHRNVTNLLCLYPGSLGIKPGTNVCQLLSVSFDMGQWEILATLMNGGTLLLRTSDWHKVLKRAHTIISTPSILATLDRKEYSNIQVVAVAGEPCPKLLADDWSQSSKFYNCCGPTEVTIVNTIQLHREGHVLSIGGPVPNTNVYILDEDENPLPIGSTGSMWAGGLCVSQGYVNLPELTAKKFKLDKFVNNGSVMFNTGDIGRWLEDGTLEHLGRVDDQVKIKGFRVELDGISAAIESIPGVSRGCAILSETILWGFYSGPSRLDETLLKDVVGRHQPYYAIPSRWDFRPVLPLTSNGKIDRKALIASMRPTTQQSFTSIPGEQKDLTKPENCLTLTSRDLIHLAVPGEPESSSPSIYSLEKYALPEKKGIHRARALRHRFFSLYRRFFSVVFLGNLITVAVILSHPRGDRLRDIATATAANLTAAVLFRQDHVVNLLFTIACSVPTSAPMFIRRNCAKVYHIGGIHSGCAVASTIWLLIFSVVATREHAAPAVLAVTFALDFLLLTIIAGAHPDFRARFHNRFELIHRFAGWTSLGLFWLQLVFFVDSTRAEKPLGRSMLRSSNCWLLVVATSSIILPWLKLRKVNVRPDVLSGHAVRLYFDYTTPVVGSAVRISENPLVEWHAFATIAKPEEKGFSLLVSNAGDWTSRQIKRAPTKLWVRGVPACGVLRIAPLFKSIVLVATGSGIGPCMPVIYARRVPARIFWSTPHPEKTFGAEIIQAIKHADKDAVIHNTKTMGRPDMVAISYHLLRESNAEAVCVISNKKLTQKIVYAMESRGIPAFGAIFDS